MRPRKIVLVISTSEITLSLRRFQLETLGFRVMCAKGAESALACMDQHVSVVLGDGTSALRWPELTAKLKDAYPDAAILLIHYDVEAVPCADVVLNDAGARNVNLLDRLKFLARRKTGPKKMPAVPAGEGSDDGQSRATGKDQPQLAIAG